MTDSVALPTEEQPLPTDEQVAEWCGDLRSAAVDADHDGYKGRARSLDKLEETLRLLVARCREAETALAQERKRANDEYSNHMLTRSHLQEAERREAAAVKLIREAGTGHGDGCADEENCTCGASTLRAVLSLLRAAEGKS